MMSASQVKTYSGTVTASMMAGSKMQAGSSILTSVDKKTAVAFQPAVTTNQDNLNAGDAIKKHERTRMKAETDCTNQKFLESLKVRAQASPRNVFIEN